MITTATISFREFLEAFLIVGVFIALSKKLRLRKEAEIITASIIGIFLSFLISLGVYSYGEKARLLFTEETADVIEGFLLVFSGIFIAYVIFSLHAFIQQKRNDLIRKAESRLEKEIFDFSLFLSIIFLILREGLEIALFTASVSLFSAFIQNALGLFIGFVLSAVLGAVTVFAYEKFPLEKVFKTTEYVIIMVGAALFQHGITILAEFYLHINLSNLGSLGWAFLPDEDTLSGHLLQGFIGIDREISIARLLIMATYIGVVYIIFFRGRKKVSFI